MSRSDTWAARLLVVAVLLAPRAARADDAGDEAKDTEVVEQTKEKVDALKEQVDENEEAQEVSAGILQYVYLAAEYLAFPAFHWVAFAVMVTGVVNYAEQLVLGKLIVLFRGGFSITEILADALGLVVSLVGLVLTTQAAAENSTFTQSPFAVLSATAVGALAGFVFYLWGQRHEIEAAKARGAQQKAS